MTASTTFALHSRRPLLHWLQWLGGGCYLLNKIFLAGAEGANQQGCQSRARHWRIAAWVVYLIGLPAWVIVFKLRRDWIAAAVETSGAPAMVLGLVLAIRGVSARTPKWLDHLAMICIPIGFAYSLYDFGGLRTLAQWLEIGLALGFLVGTYLLAKQRPNGYLWYLLMHVACGWLMLRQGLHWLAIQQLISLILIMGAYVTATRHTTR